MKKKLWMLGVAVAALTSCTQNEVLDVPAGKEIGFKSFVGNETRTQAAINNSIQDFWVFGYKTDEGIEDFTDDPADRQTVFGNTNVYASTGTGGSLTTWTYDEQQYWSTNRLYRFAAYANGADETDRSGKIDNANVEYDPYGDYVVFRNYEAGEYDLIVSVPGDRRTSSNVSNEAPVAFNFNHILSRVQFVFEEQANVKMKVMGLKIEDAIKKGTAKYYHDVTNVDHAALGHDFHYHFDTQYGNQGVAWTYDETTGYMYTTELIPSLESNAGDEMYIIPQNNVNLTATFTIVTYQDENFENEINSREVEVPLNTTNIIIDNPTNSGVDLVDKHKGVWNPGFIYRYKVIFTASEFDEFPIKFRVNSVAVWDSNITGNTEANTMLPDVDGDTDVTPDSEPEGEGEGDEND